MRGLAAALTLLLFACGENGHEAGPEASAAELIPDKTVVLTFDDAQRSHLEFVAPILTQHGFGATFFITAVWMKDQVNYLGWEEIAELHRRGFEIGNHSWGHPGCQTPKVRVFMAQDLTRVEWALETVDVPRPVSFAWPGGAFGPEGLEILREKGYRIGRRCLAPELPHDGHEGTAYDPRRHDALLIPTSSMAVPEFTFERFKESVARAKDGRAVVLTYHGIPDRTNPDMTTRPALFRKCMDHLAKNGYRVIAMRDLIPYVEACPDPEDPLVDERHPED